MATPQANNRLCSKPSNTFQQAKTTRAAARFWSPNYIQHALTIEPGRDGLFNLIKSARHITLWKFVVITDGDFVICTVVFRAR